MLTALILNQDTGHTEVPLFSRYFVRLKHFISKQKFCYHRLIHANFGSYFSVLSHLIISQALFTLISLTLSIIFFFQFSHKFTYCNSLLPGLLTFTLSILNSKLILLNDSSDLIKVTRSLQCFDYLWNVNLLVAFSRVSVVWLPPCLSIVLMLFLGTSEYFLCFPISISLFMLFLFQGIPFHPHPFPVLPWYVYG